MSLIDGLRYRLRVWLRPDAYGQRLVDEIEHHLDLERREQRGIAHDGATDIELSRRANREFGNVTYAREERRITSGLATLDSVRQDAQFAFRVIRRRPVFAAVTIATIAIGVGAATSIFSIADTVLFRPLPFPDESRLIDVWQTRPDLKKNPVRAAQWDHTGISLPTYRNWTAAQTSFEQVAVMTTSGTIVGGRDAPEELAILHASATLLPVLGFQPEIGRNFSSAEDAPGGLPVALVSHETWVARLAHDPAILGKRVQIDSVWYSIIGVIPAGVRLDRNSQLPAYWIPASQDVEEASHTGWNDFWAIARLKRGVSLETAAAETDRFMQTSAPIGSGTRGVRLAPIAEDQTRKVRQPILLLLAAATLLLVIACANVATLLMGEASSREAELRARLALGAGRRRLIRQLLTESVMLATIGGVIGTALAYAGTRVVVRLAPPWIPGLADVRVDGRVLAVALAASFIAGIVFGIIPAIVFSNTSSTVGVRIGTASALGRGRSQRALVACEVALSTVLLITGGLLVRSFAKIESVDPGFRTEHLLVVRMRLPQPQYSDTTRVRALYREILDRTRSLPGVTDAAMTTTPSFSGGSSSSSFEVEGRVAASGTRPSDAQRRITTPEFFGAAGISIIEGRSYTTSDDAASAPVVVVSKAFAQQEWPTENAVGKRIKWTGQWRTIVGVARDIKLHDLFESPTPTVYAPFDQLFRSGDLLVHHSGDAASVVASVRAVIRELAPDIPASDADEMTTLIDETLADQRFRTTLVALFAAIAMCLAAVGIYGVATTAASRRTQEMAVRVALGASNASVARLIVLAGTSGVAIGAVVGVGLAWLVTRALTPYLYAVGPADPATYAVVLALIGVAAIVATAVPARRVIRLPLVSTLRGE